MTDSMTSYERFKCVYNHEEPDRIPMRDSPWGPTITRWHKEGLPRDVGFGTFFGFDHIAGIGGDNSPRYPSRVVEETEEYVISTTGWGATMKNWKHSASVPDFLDFRIKDWETWADAKERMKPTRDRINWKHLEENYHKWRERGMWITAGAWFGYDVFASWHVGTERMLMAMVIDPEWCMDMFNHSLSVNLELLEMAWDAGYTFDCLSYPDDLGYRNGIFFDLDTYRKVLKPAHKRSCDWAHERGAKVMLHSCGNVMELLPDLIDAGFDGLNPLETKAGMDLIEIKKKYGSKLVLEGGIDVRKMTESDQIEEEVRTKVTMAKAGGGYIYHSDHSVPDSVSFADYCRVIALVRYYGKY
jgi:uroporphyrinogen decarboxylase